MKSDHHIAMIAAFAAVLSPFARSETPVPPRPAPGVLTAHEQTERAGRANIASAIYMHRLLSMNDEQLARSRHVIEKVEKLPPEKRAELRKKLERLRDATPEERQKIAGEMREKFGICCEESPDGQRSPGKGGKGPEGKSANEPPRSGHRNLLEKHWATLSPESAKAEREKFLAMTRDRKVAYVRTLREKYRLPVEPEQESKNRPEGGRETRVEIKPAGDSAPPPGEDPFRPKD